MPEPTSGSVFCGARADCSDLAVPDCLLLEFRQGFAVKIAAELTFKEIGKGKAAFLVGPLGRLDKHRVQVDTVLHFPGIFRRREELDGSDIIFFQLLRIQFQRGDQYGDQTL